MKKFFIAAVMAFIAVTASAQDLYVGGGLGFGITNNSVGGTSSSKAAWALKPEVGYYFNKDLAVGLVVNLGSSPADKKKVGAGLDIYGRYDFYRIERLTFGGELVMGMLSHGQYYGADFHTSIRPVVAIDLGHKFRIISRFDLIRFQKNNKEAGSSSNFGAGILSGNSTIDVGIEYTF